MYRITNVARDQRYKSKRVATPGRMSRTKTWRFLGRRLVPRRSMIVTDEVYEANKARLDVGVETGLLKVDHLPRGIVLEAIEEAPVVEEVVVEEAVAEEALDDLEEVEEEVEEEADEAASGIPNDDALEAMSFSELKTLASEHGLQGRSKASYLEALRSARDDA